MDHYGAFLRPAAFVCETDEAIIINYHFTYRLLEAFAYDESLSPSSFLPFFFQYLINFLVFHARFSLCIGTHSFSTNINRFFVNGLKLEKSTPIDLMLKKKVCHFERSHVHISRKNCINICSSLRSSLSRVRIYTPWSIIVIGRKFVTLLASPQEKRPYPSRTYSNRYPSILTLGIVAK